MEINNDYEKLNINPIFEPIKQLFEFYILGIGFIGQFDFQEVFLKNHPELKTFTERYNKNVNLKKDGSKVKSETKIYMISVGRIMAISLFNILEFSEYQNDLNQEEIFKFAKHIRNGAAHNNKFNIAPLLEKSIQWRERIIDNSLNGSPVFLDFINPISLMFLMADISDLIIKKRSICN